MIPIEEGCKAVVFNSTAGNDGIEVEVGKFIGRSKYGVYKNLWAVDKFMNRVNLVNGVKLRKRRSMPAHMLLRTDSEEFKAKFKVALEEDELEEKCELASVEGAV